MKRGERLHPHLPRFTPWLNGKVRQHCAACGQRIYWATIDRVVNVLPVSRSGISHFRHVLHAAPVAGPQERGSIQRGTRRPQERAPRGGGASRAVMPLAAFSPARRRP